uniref:Uncharacterized protein n=1 Tax=Spongospora subterranea TaxID=70186 RepID=A0A0H5QFX9_9EUKA|eukprot:CRZ00845.1 hypothetical protein [Spongospora subterranea]
MLFMHPKSARSVWWNILAQWDWATFNYSDGRLAITRQIPGGISSGCAMKFIMIQSPPVPPWLSLVSAWNRPSSYSTTSWRYAAPSKTLIKHNLQPLFLCLYNLFFPKTLIRRNLHPLFLSLLSPLIV